MAGVRSISTYRPKIGLQASRFRSPKPIARATRRQSERFQTSVLMRQKLDPRLRRRLEFTPGFHGINSARRHVTYGYLPFILRHAIRRLREPQSGVDPQWSISILDGQAQSQRLPDNEADTADASPPRKQSPFHEPVKRASDFSPRSLSRIMEASALAALMESDYPTSPTGFFGSGSSATVLQARRSDFEVSVANRTWRSARGLTLLRLPKTLRTRHRDRFGSEDLSVFHSPTMTSERIDSSFVQQYPIEREQQPRVIARPINITGHSGQGPTQRFRRRAPMDGEPHAIADAPLLSSWAASDSGRSDRPFSDFFHRHAPAANRSTTFARAGLSLPLPAPMVSRRFQHREAVSLFGDPVFPGSIERVAAHNDLFAPTMRRMHVNALTHILRHVPPQTGGDFAVRKMAEKQTTWPQRASQKNDYFGPAEPLFFRETVRDLVPFTDSHFGDATPFFHLMGASGQRSSENVLHDDVTPPGSASNRVVARPRADRSRLLQPLARSVQLSPIDPRDVRKREHRSSIPQDDPHVDVIARAITRLFNRPDIMSSRKPDFWTTSRQLPVDTVLAPMLPPSTLPAPSHQHLEPSQPRFNTFDDSVISRQRVEPKTPAISGRLRQTIAQVMRRRQLGAAPIKSDPITSRPIATSTVSFPWTTLVKQIESAEQPAISDISVRRDTEMTTPLPFQIRRTSSEMNVPASARTSVERGTAATPYVDTGFPSSLFRASIKTVPRGETRALSQARGMFSPIPGLFTTEQTPRRRSAFMPTHALDARGPSVFRSARSSADEPTTAQRTEAAAQIATSVGSPLPPMVRRSMEHLLGLDLASVRVHSGPRIARAADLVAARAFARGTDLFLPGGVTDSPQDAGSPLLAHELTHVSQHLGHRAPPSMPTVPLTLANRTSANEQEAERVERMMTETVRKKPSIAPERPALTLARKVSPVTIMRVEETATMPRSATSASAASPGASTETAAGSDQQSQQDQQKLADRIFHMLEQRLIVARERGGYRF